MAQSFPRIFFFLAGVLPLGALLLSPPPGTFKDWSIQTIEGSPLLSPENDLQGEKGSLLDRLLSLPKHVDLPGKVEIRVIPKEGEMPAGLRAFLFSSRNPREPMHPSHSLLVEPEDPESGLYTLQGFPKDGDFVVRVKAPGYAAAYTREFQLTEGRKPPKLSVRLSRGGRIRGRVVDSRGRPVGGAAVMTLRDEFPGDDYDSLSIICGLRLQRFQRRIWGLYRHSIVRTVTDAWGKFTLNLVAPETYKLKITRQGFPVTWRKGVRVQEGRITEEPDIVLPVGVIVFGVAYDLRGRPIRKGQVILVNEDRVNGFSSETVTDGKGRFRLPLVPPGTYTLKCSRPFGLDPFGAIVDFKKSEMPLTISGTQRRLQVNIRIKP